MVLSFDSGKQRTATWRGVLADPVGRMGMITAAILCVLSPVAGVVTKMLIDAAWRNSWDYDPWIATGLSYIPVALFLVFAFVFARRSWKFRSSGVGDVRDQLVAIDRGWMTYSFRVAGDIHLNARNVIVVRLAAQQTNVSVTQPSGVIRFDGGVWRYIDLDITSPGTNLALADGTRLAPTGGAVPPIERLERIGSFSVPDSFVPDLYQTVLANFE